MCTVVKKRPFSTAAHSMIGYWYDYVVVPVTVSDMVGVES